MSEYTAGRELDRLIAEKVLGLTVKPMRYIDGRGVRDEIGTVSPSYTMSDGRQGVQATRLPDYSTDIAAAMLVVDHMHARVFAHSCGELDREPWPSSNYLGLSCLGLMDGWAAVFTSIVPDDPEWHEHPEKFRGARSGSAPHAICLAALTALGLSHD